MIKLTQNDDRNKVIVDQIIELVKEKRKILVLGTYVPNLKTRKNV